MAQSIISRNLEVQGLRTHLLSAGERGPAVMLLHGGGIDSAMLSWEEVIPTLAQNHRVFAADWPGFGESQIPDVPCSMEYYVGFQAALMDVLGLEKASLVGISMGGGVALGFTLQNPQRVEKLVLVSSYGLQPAVPMHRLSYLYLRLPLLNDLAWALVRSSRGMVRASLRTIFHNPKAISEGLVEKAYAASRQPGAGRAWNMVQKSEMQWKGTRTCYMDRLAEIHHPTLIVHGAQDRLAPVEFARQAHRLIWGSELFIMEGCGHWPQREKPAEFSQVVGEFLRRESP